MEPSGLALLTFHEADRFLEGSKIGHLTKSSLARWLILAAGFSRIVDTTGSRQVLRKNKLEKGWCKVNQLSERDMHQHVTILGWLHIVANALFLLIGLCGFLFLVGIGFVAAANGDPTAMPILGTIGLISMLFFAVLSLPGILAGYGLLKGQRWGQILGIVVGFLSLFNFPLGTALGVYTLFVLLQNAADPYFSSQESG
jgi:hypothetical protein